MVISLHDIRSLARRYDYEEIGLNEHSRVISFRGGPSLSARVNVYYTTGTVGTCLNHPKKGKTQLFRRNIQTLNDLEAIFENPRVHMGGGYYTRQNIRQKWKDSQNNGFLADSARRWLYVGAATGLVQTQQEGRTIAFICNKWDSLIWDPNSLPDLMKTRHKCGSGGGLFQMLVEVFQEKCGDFVIFSSDDVNHYHQQRRAGNFVKKPEPKGHPTCGKRSCPMLQSFLESHSDEVEQLRLQFLSLPREIFMELALWFLCRSHVNQVFANLDVVPFHSKHNKAVHFAHVNYGKLTYPRKPEMCDHCGVLLQSQS